MRLKETTLYSGDNGRITCGRIRCAGITAQSSGHDLSGQKMMAMTTPMVDYLESLIGRPVACETCGEQHHRIITAFSETIGRAVSIPQE